MDLSREPDLRELHRVMNDPVKPKWAREAAHRSFQIIQRQMNDRALTHLRHCLIRAVRANDHKWITRYEKQIEEYSWRMGYVKPTTE